jgi:hypothetical protein
VIDICPGLATGFIPIKRGKDFQQHLLTTHPEGAFIYFVPYTWAGFINITIFGGGTPARTISFTLWALHRTDKGSFLQQAVPAHPAAE